MNGEAIDADWTGTLATGSVVLTELNENVAAEGTAEAIAEADRQSSRAASSTSSTLPPSPSTASRSPLTWLTSTPIPTTHPTPRSIQDGYLR